jgi:hypothetical protein
MTCTCGHQFCYTCGSKWRTCECTTDDELNRQAILRERRRQHERNANAEEAEIARMIAEVEDLERREAEVVRREEELLALMEEQRLQQEEAQRIEAERLEQELRQALRLSVLETCKEIKAIWAVIRESQSARAGTRRLNAQKQHATRQEETEKQQQADGDKQVAKQKFILDEKRQKAKLKHQSALDKFDTEQRDLEDDTFLDIRLHLRGKPDQEAREKRLQEQFNKQREEARSRILETQGSQLALFEAHATMVIQGLELSNMSKLAKLDTNFRCEDDNLRIELGKDRDTCSTVFERRENMIAANERLMLEAVGRGEEPTGLTEEAAMLIGPFRHGEPWFFDNSSRAEAACVADLIAKTERYSTRSPAAFTAEVGSLAESSSRHLPLAPSHPPPPPPPERKPEPDEAESPLDEHLSYTSISITPNSMAFQHVTSPIRRTSGTSGRRPRPVNIGKHEAISLVPFDGDEPLSPSQVSLPAFKITDLDSRSERPVPGGWPLPPSFEGPVQRSKRQSIFGDLKTTMPREGDFNFKSTISPVATGSW